MRLSSLLIDNLVVLVIMAVAIVIALLPVGTEIRIFVAIIAVTAIMTKIPAAPLLLISVVVVLATFEAFLMVAIITALSLVMSCVFRDMFQGGQKMVTAKIIKFRSLNEAR